MNVSNKEYHYYPKKEIVIEYIERKAGPELIPISRDRRGNP